MTAEAVAPEPADGFLALLDAIRDCTPAGRGDLVTELHLRCQPTIKRIAAGITHKYRLDRNTLGDDIESLTAEAMLMLVEEYVAGKLTISGTFQGLLNYRARSLAVKFLDSSGGLNQASGQVNLKRRIKEMRQTRDELLSERGAEPTPEEVVEATNERMLATRADAKRQGMLCSLDDYAVMMGGPSASLDEVAEVAVPDHAESTSALHSSERVTLIRLTVKRCHQDSETLGLVAEHYFAPALTGDFDTLPSAPEIAPLVGLAPQTVRSKIALVREVAREVLRDFYGITSVDGPVDDA